MNEVHINQNFASISRAIQAITKDVRALQIDRNKAAVLETPGGFTAGSVLFAKANGKITQDNSKLYWDDTNYLFQIGAATAQRTGRSLTATNTETGGGTSYFGAVVEQQYSPGATQITTTKGAMAVIGMVDGSGGTGASGSVQGLLAEAHYSQTAGTWSGSMVAVNTSLRHKAAGTMPTGTGVRSVPILSSTGNLTTWYHFFAASPSISSSGAITTSYGCYLQKQNVTGVTTGYGVYQEDSADLNFFAGPTNITYTDAATAASAAPLVIGHNSSGTPAANFAVEHQHRLKTSTTNDTTASMTRTSWATATHGSQKALCQFYIYDTAAREAMRIEASGTAAKIGFLGAAAVVRQTVAAAAPAGGTGATAGAYDTAAHRDSLITLVNDIRTAGINLGLWA